MNKQDFTKYMANRYGIDDDQAECITDMFAESLADALSSGESVSIKDIGKFESTPLFPNGIQHKNNIALAKLNKLNMVKFKPSKNLTKLVA